MESKLAIWAEQAMIEAMRQLSPEMRLDAFLAHCKLMEELREAGQKVEAYPEREPR